MHQHLTLFYLILSLKIYAMVKQFNYLYFYYCQYIAEENMIYIAVYISYSPSIYTSIVQSTRMSVCVSYIIC